MSSTATETHRKVQTRTQEDRPRRKDPVPWNVVLLDDDHHTFEYVIRMLQELFGHTATRALEIAKRVDRDGRAVCVTAHKELAELKRDQVLGFGRDRIIATCRGSMTAIIEPAERDGDAG